MTSTNIALATTGYTKALSPNAARSQTFLSERHFEKRMFCADVSNFEVVFGWDGNTYLKFDSSSEVERYCEMLGIEPQYHHVGGFENGVCIAEQHAYHVVTADEAGFLVEADSCMAPVLVGRSPAASAEDLATVAELDAGVIALAAHAAVSPHFAGAAYSA